MVSLSRYSYLELKKCQIVGRCRLLLLPINCGIMSRRIGSLTNHNVSLNRDFRSYTWFNPRSGDKLKIKVRDPASNNRNASVVVSSRCNRFRYSNVGCLDVSGSVANSFLSSGVSFSNGRVVSFNHHDGTMQISCDAYSLNNIPRSTREGWGFEVGVKIIFFSIYTA